MRWVTRGLVCALVAGLASSCSGDDPKKKPPADAAIDAGADVPGSGGAAGSGGTAGADGSAGTSGAGAVSGSGGMDASAGSGGMDASAGSGGMDASAGTGGSAGTAGSAGTGGMDASAGTGGSAGTAGSAGTGGSAGTAGSAGTGGSGGATSCSLGEACCTGGTCTGGYNCLGTTCSCIDRIHGNSYLRTDGTVATTAAGGTVVLDATTSLPLGGIIEIFEGFHHGCGLKNDNTVWCWPKDSLGNSSGQLGNGTIGGSVTPYAATEVLQGASQPLTGVTHINSGSSRCYLASATCGVLGSGQLWCWGSNDSSGGGGGSLFNDGGSGDRAYAVAIMADAVNPLTGVDAVSLGDRHACVLRSGSVWCWGANIGGPLGQGDQTARTYPTQVTLPGTAQQVGAGADVTCARVSDAVYCWGANNSGQVGIGDPATNSDGCINFCKLTPARVQTATGPLAGVTNLDVDYLAVCALRTDHTLWCAGMFQGALMHDVATQLVVTSGATDVAQHTSCSSGGIESAIRFLTRDDQLKNGSQTLTQMCP